MSGTGTRKDRGKEFQSDSCKLAQPKRVWLEHVVFGKQSTRSDMLMDADMAGCQEEGCGTIMVHAR